ncbi:ROK family protein [Desertivirga arenae]|uniref:ROK family protein n=1 Tax=Desertivirga arenae TaxID=2810309 RepID=UPI001A96D682|nr:ROK family protein [Pedobacter sp. SYSU D00823]
MSNQIVAVDINIPGIRAAIVDNETRTVVPGTEFFEEIDADETLENFLDRWTHVITHVHSMRGIPISKFAITIPGPFDYENGISLMHNQKKFESLYQQNVKNLLAERLGISPLNIRMDNPAPRLVKAEQMVGAVKGYNNILGFTLNYGLGSARVVDGVSEDANMWNKPFKDGIAEDYIGIGWLIQRYEDFTGIRAKDVAELTDLASEDEGIGHLVFNEYGENFVKFLLQYIGSFNPDALLIGGHNNAWELFIGHVSDRLGDKDIKIPIVSAILGPSATLIGAAALWD